MTKCPKSFPESFFRQLQPEAQSLLELTWERFDEDCRQRVLEVIRTGGRYTEYSPVFNFMTAMMDECSVMKDRCDPNFHKPSSNSKKLN